MQKFESTENIPTWSLPYLINDDPSGLTDEEIKMVDDFVNKCQVAAEEWIKGKLRLSFYYPLFGQAAEVEPCIVIYAKEQ